MCRVNCTRGTRAQLASIYCCHHTDLYSQEGRQGIRSATKRNMACMSYLSEAYIYLLNKSKSCPRAYSKSYKKKGVQIISATAAAGIQLGVASKGLIDV